MPEAPAVREATPELNMAPALYTNVLRAPVMAPMPVGGAVSISMFL